MRLKLPKGFDKRRITQELLDDAIRHRLEHGEDHPLAETKIIRWQNPRRDGHLAEWRQGNQEDAWLTLENAIRAGLPM